MTEHFDVLVVGAGISGIGAGYHLQSKCPDKTYAILEGRSDIGGTWDLFRYPGIRSDSDMHTLGFSFRPWTDPKAIADGPSILKYLRDTAEEYGIDKHIRYNSMVKRASWSTTDSTWTVDVEHPDTKAVTQISCNFLFMCAGYYKYDQGYTPDFPGAENFKGQIVHPQFWTDDIDYKNKKVVVIGSGATAVTLVPEMAKDAAHVTMLQRSPTYVVSRPQEDAIANWLRKNVSSKVSYGLTRWKNVLMGMYFYNLCKRNPERVKKMILNGVREQLGEDYDIDTHFTPTYNPWDQRLCLVPNGDLFDAIKDERASVVTDHIETFTETGIKLKSGQELEADLIVTATGLALEVVGGADLYVDGEKVSLSDTMYYKGMMYSGVPNLASSFGYTNASWTLRSDLTCSYVCRLVNHMDAHGFTQCTPTVDDPDMEEMPWVDFSSGYIQRSMHLFPKQGTKNPWKLPQNYAKDTMTLKYGSIEDGMVFSSPPKIVAVSREPMQVAAE